MITESSSFNNVRDSVETRLKEDRDCYENVLKKLACVSLLYLSCALTMSRLCVGVCFDPLSLWDSPL